MQIFVDADACPVVGIIETIAEKYNIPTTLLCDTNHILYSDYSEVIVVGAGASIKEILSYHRTMVLQQWHWEKVLMPFINRANGTRMTILIRCSWNVI